MHKLAPLVETHEVVAGRLVRVRVRVKVKVRVRVWIRVYWPLLAWLGLGLGSGVGLGLGWLLLACRSASFRSSPAPVAYCRKSTRRLGSLGLGLGGG